MVAGWPATGSSSGATWTVTATPLLVAVWWAIAPGATARVAAHAATPARARARKDLMSGVVLLGGCGIRVGDGASAGRSPGPGASHEQTAGPQQRPAGRHGYDD